MRMKGFLSVALGAMLLVLAGCTMGQAPPPGDFNVTVALKTTEHPAFGVGDAYGYVVNGTQGKELTLTRGTTYTFSIDTPGHSFYLTNSAVGGPGFPGEITAGVTGSRTDFGTLTFTPDSSTSALIYYQCGFHPDMGWKVNIVP